MREEAARQIGRNLFMAVVVPATRRKGWRCSARCTAPRSV